MIANARLMATSSRSLMANRAPLARIVAAQPVKAMHTSSVVFKGPPTHSEESVKAEKHQFSPEELQKKTASGAQSAFESNNIPTASEEAAKADRHEHDPLPEDKKKKSGKPPQ